jgi:hypothetical protein
VTQDPLLTRKTIHAHLQDVAAALGDQGPQHVVIVVGGAILAWRGLRDSTRDVDSVSRLDAELVAAVEAVAQMRGLPIRWLNDSASAHLPQTLQLQACGVLLDHSRLKVLGAPIQQVFLMKVMAARTRDKPDLVAMWPELGLTARDVVLAFGRAYPDEPDDPYLLAWIGEIERAAALGGNGSS